VTAMRTHGLHASVRQSAPAPSLTCPMSTLLRAAPFSCTSPSNMPCRHIALISNTSYRCIS